MRTHVRSTHKSHSLIVLSRSCCAWSAWPGFRGSRSRPGYASSPATRSGRSRPRSTAGDPRRPSGACSIENHLVGGHLTPGQVVRLPCRQTSLSVPFKHPVVQFGRLDLARGSRPRLPRDLGLGPDRAAGADRAARPARGRAAALRLREGHTAAAPALHVGLIELREIFLDPLPRRPLPRAAGDDEDVRAARPRDADDDLRPAGARRPVRPLRRDVRQAHVPVRAGRARARRDARPRRLPPRGDSRSTTASAVGYALVEDPARAVSTSRRRRSSAFPRGRLRARSSGAKR